MVGIQQHSFRIVLLLLFLSLGLPYCTNYISCFEKSLFKFDFPPVGFYELDTITSKPFFDPINIIAYGDFNGDLVSTDFVTLTRHNNQTDIKNDQLFIYLWSVTENAYQQTSIINEQSCSVQNIYLYDINSDGLLDITIFGRLMKESVYENCLVPYFRKQPSMDFVRGNELTLTTSSQPTYFSYGAGNEKNIIKGFVYYSTVTKTRNIAVFEYGIRNEYVINPWNSTFVSTNSFQNVSFSDPHWNSFLDLTGDCQSDLVLVDSSMNIEIWINNGNKFNFYKFIKYGEITSLSFSDLNYDGTPDLIVTFHDRVSVSYNQRHLTSASDFCCTNCKQFILEPLKNVILFESVPQQYEISMEKQVLHIEDIDINGYPDILLYLTNTSAANVVYDFPIIYLNSGENFQANTDEYSFNVMLSQVWLHGDIVSVSFIDFLENGILDVLVTVAIQENVYHLYSFYNNRLQQNSFFIKGFGASGTNSSSGCQITGSSFMWVNSLGDSIRCAFQPQIIQTAYNALQLPYGYSGLGRANNYVQSFTLGIYGMSKSWSPIIPNSQLAVYASSSSPVEWGIRIFVLPTDSLAYVIIVSAIILILMGILLLILKYFNHKKKEQPLMMDFIN